MWSFWAGIQVPSQDEGYATKGMDKHMAGRNRHSHQFVESQDANLAFGLDPELDKKALICYLQKFSDDQLLQSLVPRLSQQEMQEVLDLIYRLLRAHLSEKEYHELFLKQGE